MFRTLVMQHCGKRLELIANCDVLLAIKDDRIIQNKVIQPWSVHRLYSENAWILGGFVKGFDSLEDAKAFIEARAAKKNKEVCHESNDQ